MKCPLCSVDLVMSDRQGIEIDYCPKCRGVWLDRGELDKIIERSEQINPPPQAAPPPPPQAPQPGYPGHHGYRLDKDDSHYGYPYKKRKSWLEEIFD